MYKENENLKKREYDFKGLLDSGELEAQIQFKDQELQEYRQKLDQERVKNAEFIQELKEENSHLKKAGIAAKNDQQDARKLKIYEKELVEMKTKNTKYEKRIQELQNFLTKDSDKLTQAQELQ